jgi:molybdopterin-guanine dinucleotide biosynthesis protein A
MHPAIVRFTKSAVNFLVSSESGRKKIYALFIGIYETSTAPFNYLRENIKDLHFTLTKKTKYSDPKFSAAFRLTDSPPKLESLRKKSPKRCLIILAAGEGVRWQEEGLKQLAVVDNKPLIEHQLDHIPSALIVSHHPQLLKYLHVVPAKHQFILETLLSTKPLWADRTTVLLGDVYFSPEDLNQILACREEFAVFGSKPQIEIFALSFTKSFHSHLTHHLYRALDYAYGGGRGKLWEFYHSFIHSPLNKKRAFGRRFVNLSETTDVDSLEDYRNLIKETGFQETGDLR